MSEDGGVESAHPVIGVRTAQAVRDVVVRFLGRGRRAGRGRHGRHRTPALAAAALLVPSVLVGAVLGTPGPARATSADDPLTFTVGIGNEVDSFNPFLGIEAESYEMWALTYDYMISYSMKDMSPQPGLATSWDTSDDGLTWTFHIRTGVMFSDGVPLTAKDIAYTYNRIIDGGPEAASWESYLTSVTKVEAPDDTTVVLTLKKPNAVLPLLPIPIVPEHIWQDVSEKDVKTYAAEPKDGQPVVGSGPFRLVEGTAGGSTYRFEANPDYWGGAPHIDQVVFKVFKSDDPMVQALIKGEIDFAEDITPLQVKALESQDGITSLNGQSPGFDEIAFNTGAVDTETDKPIGDGNPALKDPKFRHALGYALDLDQIVSKVYQGAGLPGDTLIPPAYSNWRWEPSEDEAFSFDLDKAGSLLDEAGYTKGSDGKRTMPDGSPLGTLRLFARSESKTSIGTMDYFKEWLGDLGIDAEVTNMESNKLTNVILDGDFDAFQWGWYVEPDPDSMLSYMTCDQRGGWSDSWYCNPEYDALYADQNSATDDAQRKEDVTQMQQILFEDSPYLITEYNTYGEAFRSDRFACFEPQPDPGGILLFQYGVHNYLNIRPADQAGDCDGISTALGAQTSEGGKPAAGSGSGGNDDGSSTPFVVVGGVVLAALVLGGGGWALRRRSTSAERE
jgi:peptide/nickel transport system substrate-binding protein